MFISVGPLCCEQNYCLEHSLRPIFTIRFVACDSYSGICDRVNMPKKRQISNYAVKEGVKIWHQRSFPYARVRTVCHKSYCVDTGRPLKA